MKIAKLKHATLTTDLGSPMPIYLILGPGMSFSRSTKFPNITHVTTVGGVVDVLESPEELINLIEGEKKDGT